MPLIIAVVLLVLTLCFVVQTVTLAGALVRLCFLLVAWCAMLCTTVVLATILSVQALRRYRKPRVEILPPEEFDRYGRGADLAL